MIGKGHIMVSFERALNRSLDLAKKAEIEKLLEQLESGQLNEGVSADLIAKITGLLKEVKDSAIIQDILIRLYKSTFDQRIDAINLEKEIPPKDGEDFKRKFYAIRGSYDEKNEFLDILEKGVFDFKSIDNNSVVSIGSIVPMTNQFIMSMTQEMTEWTPKMGAKSAVGAGEAFFIYFVAGGKKASSGDFSLGSNKYEVKATKMSNGSGGGRVKGMGKYSPNLVQHLDFFMEELKAIHGRKLKLPKNPNSYNFRTKFKELNSILPDTKEKTKELLAKLFTKIYGSTDLGWLDNAITKRGKVVDNFHKHFGYYQASSYIEAENFKKYIFINTANQTILVTSIKQLKKHIDNEVIAVKGSCSFNDAVSSTYQFGLAN